MMTLVLLILSAFVLALFAGSMLTEAVILVPYWRSMEPKAFFDLHGSLGLRLFKYFAPLTMSTVLIPAVAASVCIFMQSKATTYSIAAAAISLSFLIIFFLYFKSANNSFADGSLSIEKLPEELLRWSHWHWVRTILAMLALSLSLIAIAAA